MNRDSILALYTTVSNLKPVDLGELVEERLDKLLNSYEDSLQESFDAIRQYDTMEVIRGLNNSAKFD